jgi:hypothetical protein
MLHKSATPMKTIKELMLVTKNKKLPEGEL